jgi:hypothetical protein
VALDVLLPHGDESLHVAVELEGGGVLGVLGGEGGTRWVRMKGRRGSSEGEWV